MRHLGQVVFLVFLLFACKRESTQSIRQTKIATMCAPDLSDQKWYRSDGKAPLFEGLGDFHFEISTENELVQRYFDQGMVLSFGFNHAEAARSFYYASKLDPDCAMAYWGYAYVLGPNYNSPMDSENYAPAFKAIQKALDLSQKKGSEKEKDLIKALKKRYLEEAPSGRLSLDLSYAEALNRVYKKYPNDATIGTLYAESLMNLHPWDLYTKNGVVRPWTYDIVQTLEGIIEEDPLHPGAHHFYIHAVEASKDPSAGLKSAQLFDEDLVANAGHLVHMPSHIYIRTGDYDKGTKSNIRAIKVDSAYVTACHAQGVYPLTYYPHKQHFMSATASLSGNSVLALHAAKKVAENANRQLMKRPGWGTLQHYYTIPFYVNVKFAKWDAILAMENEAADLDYPSTIFHYARGMAFIGKDNLASAKKEYHQLSVLSEKNKLKDISIWEINSVSELTEIARLVLEAKITEKEGDLDQSIAILRAAIAIEDQLNYNEPPDWFFSVRHQLGKTLLDNGQIEEAIDVYHQDLERFPKNGWALNGLADAYGMLGEEEKALEYQRHFTNAWTIADIELDASVVKD